MELQGSFHLVLNDSAGLIGLAIIAALIGFLGYVALSRNRGQAGGFEVSARVRSGHGLDEAQQSSVPPPDGRGGVRPDRKRPGGHLQP